MDIPNKEDFQPSSEAFNQWLKTRKKELRIAGMPIKPLFSDSGNSKDTTWFTIVVILEIVGVLATLYGGLRSGGMFAIIAIAVVFALAVVDFILLAPKLHRNVGKKTLLAATIPTHEDPSKIAKLESEMEEGKWTDFWIIVGLILIAIIKTIAILIIGTFDSPIIYVVFLILFLIIVFAHIKHTGYYLAYRETQKLIDRDFDVFKEGTMNKSVINDDLFETNVELRKIPFSYNSHEIVNDVKNENDSNHIDNKYKYKLITKGVLTDQELIKLTAGQENENKLIIFKKGRDMQLEYFGLGQESN
jgi:ABC-type multidrug transport system fused ATPase/permease subunit